MGIDTKLCGSRIRAVRKARNMTAYRLAEMIGLSEVSLTHIECGSRGPSLQTIYNIAEALDTSIDYLTGRVDKPEELVQAPMIEEQNREDDKVETVLVYRNLKNGRLKEFSIEDDEWQNEEKWEWVETRVDNETNVIQTLVSEFSISDPEGDVTKEVLTREGYVYLLCVTNPSKLNNYCKKRMRRVVEYADKNGGYVICITPNPLRSASYYDFGDGAEVRCYNIDATVMKTLLRATNGMVVLKDGVIENKYNCSSIDY